MRVEGNRILDDSGRVLLLRGCNLGGSSKIPFCPPEAAPPGKFLPENPASVSFAGRPFPLEEAEEHFDRLARWGMSFVRLVITWEALEHGGPGIYDEAYIAYLRKLLLIAESRSIAVFLDPHQDVWSRWTGGCGAPAWTLEKAGIDPGKLGVTGAAVTYERYLEFSGGAAFQKKEGSNPFFWPVNYSRYGAATMFTLFFGGNAYAPDFKIEGESAQDWLQEKYIAAFRHCYRRLKNCKAIAGWGIMNEPHPGFIGYRDLSTGENHVLALGPMPSPFEAMAAASGHPVKTGSYVPRLKNPLKTGDAILNPGGGKLFAEGRSCPWKEAGIWTDEGGSPRLLKKDYFALYNGRPAVFASDFLKPFLKRFMERMNEAGRPCVFFVEGVPGGDFPEWKAEDGRGAVSAFHCYDGPVMFLKSFNRFFAAASGSGKIVFGRKKRAAFWADALGLAVKRSREKMGEMPCLLAEFGLPFDLDKKRAYKNGDYSRHEEALSLYYDGIDKNLLHSAIWNYTYDNNHKEGDGWNGEDFSIYCGEDGGGRAVKGWLRPYPVATAGEPLEISWNRKKLVFRYRFRADPSASGPTVIFCPLEIFGSPPAVSAGSSGAPAPRAEYCGGENGKAAFVLIHSEGFDGEIEVTLRPEARAG